MQIQINTDHNVEGHARLIEHVRGLVETALSRYSKHITRVEVHLSDENADKTGGLDKRCMIEARFEHRQPIAVTDHASDVDAAVHGAVHKLGRLIESTLGRVA
ncbi:MAG: HPF/RaiA family ribosome-associated protein [Rudaea sp.]